MCGRSEHLWIGTRHVPSWSVEGRKRYEGKTLVSNSLLLSARAIGLRRGDGFEMLRNLISPHKAFHFFFVFEQIIKLIFLDTVINLAEDFISTFRCYMGTASTDAMPIQSPVTMQASKRNISSLSHNASL